MKNSWSLYHVNSGITLNPVLKEKKIRQKSYPAIWRWLQGSGFFLLYLLVCISCGCTATGETPGFLSSYKTARDHYNNKNYTKARDEFARANTDNPDSLLSENIKYYSQLSERKIENTDLQLDNIKQSSEKQVLKEIEGLIPADLMEYDQLSSHKTAPEENKETTEEARLITNVFFETDMREALRDISAQAGTPLVADSSVQGLVSLEVQGVPLEDTLKIMLSPGGYTYKKMDGYYLIGTAEPGSPTFDRLTTTIYIKPTYFSAKEVSGLLSSSFRSYIQVSEEQNVLTITASDEMIERIRTDISKIDKAPRQIVLQAVVTDISESGINTLSKSMNWTFSQVNNDATRKSLQQNNVTSQTLNFDPSSLGSVGLSYATTGKLVRSLISTIKALIENNEAVVRATPRISTLDGRQARIFIGSQETFSVTSGPTSFQTTQLERIDAGIILDVTPRIAESGDITVTINQAEVSHVEARGDMGLPIVSKRSVNTTVRVKDGETIVIGGLMQKRKSETKKKIPLLGNLPYLGGMFRSVSHGEEETEVLIMITPHILQDKDILDIDV